MEDIQLVYIGINRGVFVTNEIYIGRDVYDGIYKNCYLIIFDSHGWSGYFPSYNFKPLSEVREDKINQIINE